jgi:hypothetical protein
VSVHAAPPAAERDEFRAVRLARGVQFTGLMKREENTQLVTRSDSTPATSGQEGKIGWILAWLVGIPLPVLLVVYLFSRAC